MMTNNKKHVSLLVLLAMLVAYAVPFSTGVYADYDSPWAENSENYELMATDSSLGLTTISEDYTFISDTYTESGTTSPAAGLIDNNRVKLISSPTVSAKKGSNIIGEESYLNSIRLKGSVIAFNVAKNASVTVYTENHTTRYVAATSSAAAKAIDDSSIIIARGELASDSFSFTVDEDTTIYLGGYNDADNTYGDIYIAGFTVEFNSDDDPSVTDSPKETDAPDATDTPAVTETPDATDTPTVTEAPDATDTPTVTEAPVITDAPSETTQPENTPQPTAAAQPTEEPDPNASLYTWNVSADDLTKVAGDSLMPGLTMLFTNTSTNNKYISSGDNGSVSGTGTTLQFIAPVNGKLSVTMIDLSGKTAVIYDVAAAKNIFEYTAGSEKETVNLVAQVEAGKTYYIAGLGTKGRFSAASFTPDEGEVIPSPTPAPTTDPSATEAPVLSSDEQDVMADAEALQLKAISQTAIYSDIDLDMKGSNGSTITWESSDSRYIDIQTVSSINRNYTGVVTRPREDECTENGGVPVTLTATLTKGDAEYKKEFNVSVRKWNPNVYYNDFQADVGQSEDGTYKAIADNVAAANGKDTFRGIRVDTLKESRCFADFSHQDQDTPTYFDKRIMSTEASGANYGRPADSDSADDENFAFYLSEYNAYGGSTTYTTLWINLIDPETGTAPAGIVMMTMDVYVIDGGNKLNMGFETSGQSQMCRFLLSNGSTTFQNHPAAGYLRTFSNESSIDFMGGTSGYRHPTGKWIKATLIANSDSHKWDFYYDGMQICTGNDFRNAEDFVSTIEFTMDRSSSGGAYLIDNIYVENLTEDYANTYWDALMIDSLSYNAEDDTYTATQPFMLQYQGTDGLVGNDMKWSSSDSNILSISTQRIDVERLAEFGYSEDDIALLKANGYADVSVTIATPNENLTEDKTVTLTASMEVGSSLQKKTFTVLVKASGTADANSDSAKALQDANAISCIANGQTITGNVTMETTGKINGSEITWKSSNASVFSANGVVTRPSGNAITVTLTAAVKYGEAVEYKTFNVTVSPKTTAASGGGGGGGGGSSVKGTSVSNIASAPVDTSSYATAQPTATARPAGMPAFDDLDQAPWAADAIDYLFRKDIVNGYGDGLYGVNDNVTREQFVRMLLTALNIKLVVNDESTFKDVEEEQWYTNYVNAALKLGIVTGISEEEFGVGQQISRQDMAVMCVRAMELISAKPELTEDDEITEEPETTEEPEVTEEPEATEEPEEAEEPEATEEQEEVLLTSSELLAELKFTDKEEISDYALKAVAWMTGKGYLLGDENGNFAPKKSLTRAETAMVLYRILIQEDI